MAVPEHVAIILDGNGRWAKSKGMPRTYGHTVGAKNVETISRAAYDLGIKYLTMYAFSTENWKRPSDEVATLMKLFDTYLKTLKKTAKKENLKFRMIGDISGLDPKLQAQVREIEEESSVNTGLNLNIAINYGSRDELVRAMRRQYADLTAELLIDGTAPADPEAAIEEAAASITEESFGDYLDTAGIPDPDLMIRTSGEQRLSNYLLWQLAYAEFYFTPIPWPEFDAAELKKAVEAYENRDRRYGKI